MIIIVSGLCLGVTPWMVGLGVAVRGDNGRYAGLCELTISTI